ncbi:MAG TPA: protein kinase [Polyangiaceae bacterium]|nr:protein kinase [Polyangiaceae bacterium]
MPSEVPPRLELVGIEKSLTGGHALRGAHLTARAGEIVGLCGEAGAGKSTLVKILAGVHPHGTYRGEVVVDGRPLRLTCPADARRACIAVVHQKIMLVPELSVAQNLMLGREPRRFGLVDEARLEAQASAHLGRFDLKGEIDPGATVGELGIGVQHIVEIVRALSHDAKVLVLDEPAASLATEERARLLTWLRTLKRSGTTCIYVSHRMDEVFGFCDRIVVLRDGRTAQTLNGAPAERCSPHGRYVIHDEIAAGGMATIHLGRMLGPFGFGSTVAIKRLYPQLAKDPQFVAMFLDEARLASRVRHPNVVPVLDVLADEGEICLVLEYVDGESLGQLLRDADANHAPIPVPIAATIAVSILYGLHAAHEARDEQGTLLGVVHRDVSPQNVIVGVDGVARLIDFGIAKAAGRCNVSRDGQLKGKVAYMAPEQIQRGLVGPRADVYGASVILWELLAGERLFEGDTEGMILGRVLDDDVLRPSQLRSDVPPALDALVLRGLDRAQQRRFESARSMALALESAVRPATPAEVGAWVEGLAGARLAERRERMTRMEREATDLQRAPAPPRAGWLEAPASSERSPRAGGISAALGTLLPVSGRRSRW